MCIRDRAYHLDCLNPPMCEVPSKDKFWMCPSHMEHFLDKILTKSSRLTERIKCWNAHASLANSADGLKGDFFKKINAIKHSNTYESVSTTAINSIGQNSLVRCQIPAAIKKIYSRQTLVDVDQNVENEQETEQRLVRLANVGVEVIVRPKLILMYYFKYH